MLIKSSYLKTHLFNPTSQFYRSSNKSSHAFNQTNLSASKKLYCDYIVMPSMIDHFSALKERAFAYSKVIYSASYQREKGISLTTWMNLLLKTLQGMMIDVIMICHAPTPSPRVVNLKLSTHRPNVRRQWQVKKKQKQKQKKKKNTWTIFGPCMSVCLIEAGHLSGFCRTCMLEKQHWSECSGGGWCTKHNSLAGKITEITLHG